MYKYGPWKKKHSRDGLYFYDFFFKLSVYVLLNYRHSRVSLKKHIETFLTNNDLSCVAPQVVERGTITAGVHCVTIFPLITAVIGGACHPTIGNYLSFDHNSYRWDVSPDFR